MSILSGKELREHIGHKIECVGYFDKDDCLNVAVECETCGEVLFDMDYGHDTGVN